MANIVNSDQDPDKNNPNQNPFGTTDPISVGGSGAVYTGVSGNGVGPSATATTAPATVGTYAQAPVAASQVFTGNSNPTGVFANVNAMTANNQSPNYSFINNKLQSEQNDLFTKMNSAYGDYLTKAGSTPTYDPTKILNAVNTGDATQLGDVKNWLTASYTGPTSWDTSSFSPALTNYQSELKSLNSADGLYNWLIGNVEGETPGSAQADAASIWAAPDFQKNYADWNSSLTNLNGVYDNNNKGAQAYATNMKSGYTNLANAVQNDLYNLAGQNMTGFNQALQDARNQENQVYMEYAGDMGQSGEHGVNRGQYYEYKPGTAATLENVLTADKVKQYNNIEQLLGGTAINPVGGWSKGSVNFNSGDYNTAVETAAAAEKAQQDAAAAQQQQYMQMMMSMMSQQGGGGGGSSLICTELKRQGLMDRKTQFKLAQYFLKYSDKFWAGYWSIALPTSWLMKRSPFITSVMNHFFQSMAHNDLRGKVYRGIMLSVSVAASLFSHPERYGDWQNKLLSTKATFFKKQAV